MAFKGLDTSIAIASIVGLIGAANSHENSVKAKAIKDQPKPRQRKS